MDINDLSLRQLQQESARALSIMQATNNNIWQFNSQARHDSRCWYRAVIKWYIKQYNGLPSAVGPGVDVKLIDV